HPDGEKTFGQLRAVIIDEVHALAGSKRGDLLALGLARLSRLAPQARHVGLSATLARPDGRMAGAGSGGKAVHHIAADAGPLPRVDMLEPGAALPWAGHMGLFAMGKVYEAIERHRSVIVFVNTRAQAELIFQELWRRNDKN